MKMVRRLLIILIMLLAIIISNTYASSASTDNTDLQKQVTQLRQQFKTVSTIINSLQLQQKKDSEQIAVLTSQLQENSKSYINNTTAQFNELKDEIASLKSQLKKQEDEINGYKLQVDKLKSQNIIQSSTQQQDNGSAVSKSNSAESINDKALIGTDSKVFNGFFQNVSYDNPEVFINPGEQTKIDDNVRKIAETFNDKKDISTLREIFKWMQDNLVYADGEKFGRTSIDIIESRKYTGCTDMGLAFIAFTRAKGIPSVFVQTGRIDWIEKLVKNDPGKGFITGHILVEVQLSDKKWYLVDSTAGKLYLDYDRNNFSLPDGFYVFAKSIEVWDTGIKDEKSNGPVMFDVFKDFDLQKYINPRYNYIDLITGEQKKSGIFNNNSLVIGNGGVILGEKEPVGEFKDKYFNGISTTLAAESNVSESTLTTSAVLVVLHIKGSQYPDYLKKYVPDIGNNTANGTVYKYTREGQKIYLIVGDSNKDLVNIVDNLPDDFLTK